MMSGGGSSFGGGGVGVESVKDTLSKLMKMADQTAKWAEEAETSRQECLDLKPRAEKLSALLRQAARADLYERPARRIGDDTEQALEKALSLVDKCRPHGLVRRLFTIIPATAFRKVSTQLDNSTGNLSWLLRASVTANSSSSGNGDDDYDDDIHLGLPPIAQNDPILFLIWEQIATLHTGSLDSRADAAASLASLARDNDRYGGLIIAEDGVGPLLRLVKEGRIEGQENAVRALGLLGRDTDSVDKMVQSGVCSVFSKVLKDGPMKVQAAVAWAVSELAGHYPKCQDMFAQNNAVRLLVGHIAFETVQEHSKYAVVPSKVTSLHSAVLAKNTTTSTNTTTINNNNGSSMIDANAEETSVVKHPMGSHGMAQKNQMHSLVQSTLTAKSTKTTHQQQALSAPAQPTHTGSISGVFRGRELEDPATKAYMKAMAAKALSQLAKGNSAICKSLTESKALLCFAVLLEKSTDDIQYNSALALMEIARVAEQDADLRRSTFKPNSPAAMAVVDQLLRIVEEAGDDDLLVLCVIALGCLSRTFRATERRIIGPLVRLLDERESAVSKEAAIALSKFACGDNYLHKDHSSAIIAAGGAKHLIQLVYFSEQAVQVVSLLLLCYIAQHVPESEELAQAEVLTALEWAGKQASLIQSATIEVALMDAKEKLGVYQPRVSW